MNAGTPSFTIGIEEEYLLVDKHSGEVAIDPPKEIFDECQTRAEHGVVEHELLRSQIEVETPVCHGVAEAGVELARLRRLAAEVAGRHGLAPIAASTHPFGEWHEQRQTDKARYDVLTRDMQSLARRLLICGMHVHVGIDDDELRVTLLNAFAPYLPLLLALSTSSPFWQGEDSGLKSYRLTVFDNFPRSGLPEWFEDFAAYSRDMDMLRELNMMPDNTFIWWDMRISARYPTLESRVTDVCTRLDDALAIAALTQSLLRYLYRMHLDNPKAVSRPPIPRFLIGQNRWRAMRYGCDEGLADFARGEMLAVDTLLRDLVERLMPDAEALGCAAQLRAVLDIPRRGTSAHRQLEIFRKAVASGAAAGEALREVVRDLIEQSVPRC